MKVRHQGPTSCYIKKENAMDYNNLPLILTVDQLADILSIGRNTAYDLVRSGQIRSVRVGRQIRIPRDALIDFLSQNS